ncbi:phosphoribosylaminoimidazolesuccinocarboxamide synthase [Candidatus Woesebacteria bacterium RBG_16_34_12]|uniref:Phosphoribosylaminoimidazole-succinocarboxamide synthase n=1 Tax=Candidatus Woesebacteria bacterium RBG_16_34_12 TaxID=1802480 RepID=A0A1F7XAQ8_9BACT|nr:MAG: phosphoribosylaminoimidazolesuccinocarboxamide synthase [Candidatus Woesebacteria bacterium RBG_16_34_12]
MLKTVNLTGFGKKYQGKVRDYYFYNGKRIIVTSDRISAFDRILGEIQYKGQVLNQLAAFWFNKTSDIIPNHVISIPDPNVTIAKNCTAYPIEMVIRGYISGSTITSLWYNYDQGKRTIYGLKFPDGLKKNQILPQPVITPTTRGISPGNHDEKISKAEIIKRKIIPKKIYEEMEEKAFALFEKATEVCAKAGLILVDTKIEFGDNNGELTVIDEIFTPDSSRFWIKDSYQKLFEKGKEPENFDKEFFRLWFTEKGYRGDGKAPTMPQSFRSKVSKRYTTLYEMITNKKFEPEKGNIELRIKKNLKHLTDRVIIIAGSTSDKAFVEKLEKPLKEKKIEYSIYYASAHKNPLEILRIIDIYKRIDRKVIAVTVAGRSNALSGFVAANSDFVVIACPPFKDKNDYLVNIHSTLQMPSNVPVMTVIDPGNAVLAVERILNK